MHFHHVTDWDAAYANSANIAGGELFPARWAESSAAFRAELVKLGRADLDIPYGERPRQVFDLFRPEGIPRGLVVIVHGGYWMAFDKSSWSHLARGALEQGHAVALPSYTLCPESRIADVTREVGMAIAAAARRVDGGIRLTGHSAGGHLVTRMICRGAPIAPDVQRRIVNTVSISGLHDLRPLMKTAMNAKLKIDSAEAAQESPALRDPMDGARLTCWVGGSERAEFLRQSELLANIWIGLGATTSLVVEPDRHHFNIIDGLADPQHALIGALLGG